MRLAQFLISELPVAVVRQHLLRGEPPPQLIDRIIRATYRAVMADYRHGKPVRAAGDDRPQRRPASARHWRIAHQAGMKRHAPAP